MTTVRIPAIVDVARDLDISVPHLRRLYKHTTGSRCLDT
jgi:AraC-like DNA-binding protein